MNISFDLDSTLIPYETEFETEQLSFIARLCGVEPIRKGSKELISDLQKQGNKVNIYTTSFRSKNKIRFTLWYYGIRVDKIITQHENQSVLKSMNIYSSKYPPAFNFDIHIDDSKGVGMEAEKYNFKVIIIDVDDKDWVDRISKRILEISNFK